MKTYAQMMRIHLKCLQEESQKILFYSRTLENATQSRKYFKQTFLQDTKIKEKDNSFIYPNGSIIEFDYKYE